MRAPPLFPVVFGSLIVGVVLFVTWAHGAPARELARREAAWGIRIQAGDVVFQDLDCGLRCELIREVTHSRYAHVGIVLEQDGERVVWEALGPVGPTPLANWVRRGRGGDVAVYRMDEALRANLPAIAREILALRGLPYDSDYQWDDDRIYCSELIAKAVQRATGSDYFPPHPSSPDSFGDKAPVIRKLSKGRLTEDTPLVSPADLARSPHLRRLVDELGGSDGREPSPH